MSVVSDFLGEQGEAPIAQKFNDYGVDLLNV